MSLPFLNDYVPEWTERALCAQTDPEAFYPVKGGSTRAAKKVCAACPVQQQCLEWALSQGEVFGVWGGSTHRERRTMPGWTYTPRGAA